MPAPFPTASTQLGACFAYALAKSAGEPLLFKGEDFSWTDLVPAAIAQAGPGEGA